MSKGNLTCSKCGARAPELFSPGWTCADCVPADIRKLYPLWSRNLEKKG